MKKKRVLILCRAILVFLGSLTLINALIASAVSNFNTGIVLTFALGTILLLCGLFLGVLICRIPKWLWGIFLCGVAAVFLCSSALLLYGKNDTALEQTDAIIVLGAGIHGERVSLTLRNRLDAAIQCYERNPQAVIAVSGGMGPEEDITEALAMERYLIAHGIPKEQIIKEERATSTLENFMFSKALLDSYFEGEYSAVFVTNDFHVFRAGHIARRAGFDSIGHVHSATVPYLVVPSCLRECTAILWMLVKGG